MQYNLIITHAQVNKCYTVKYVLLSTDSPTVAHNCRVKSKSLASKAKVSPQKQNARRKSKTLAAKAKRSPQKQNSRVKSKTLASKLASSQASLQNSLQDQLPRTTKQFMSLVLLLCLQLYILSFGLGQPN